MADQWDSIPSAPVVQKAPSWDTIPATTNPPVDTTSVNPPIDNSPFTDASHTELKRSYLGSPDRSLVLYKGKPVEDANPFPNNDNFGYFGNKAYHLLAGALNDPFSAATLAYGRLKGFIHPDEIPKVATPDEIPKDIPLPKPNPLKPRVKLNKDGTYTKLDTGAIVDSTGKDVSAYPEGLRTSKGKVKLTFSQIPDDPSLSSSTTPNTDNIPALPKDLQGAKPRFNIRNSSYSPQFGNDVDKAGFIISQKVPSKRDAAYLKFVMDSTGLDEQGARDFGNSVRAHIKSTLANHIKNSGEEGDVSIPSFFNNQNTTTPTIGTNLSTVIPPLKVEPVNINSGDMPNVSPPNQPPPPNDFTVKDWWNNPKANRVADVLNVPKSMQTTLDLSAPLRQGRALAHKKEFWTSLDDMFKSAGSEEGYQAVNDSIRATPKFEEAANSGLSFTDLSDNVGHREEQFGSKLAEAIPGYGKLVRGSGRAYTGFLNKLRMDVYQNLASGYEKAGIAYNPQHLADFINTASGRGRLFGKEMEQAAPFLNNYIYSPRLIASRVRMLNPVTYVNADPLMRKEYLKSMFSLIGSTALLGKIANTIPGVSVSANPTSSDFGKVKVGNTRHDLMGGFQQYVVLLSKLAHKQLTSSSGKVIPIDSGKYGAPTTFSTLADFGRNKLAPIPSAALNSLAGKDPLGNNTNAFKEAGKLFVPMLVQDIYDIYKDDPSQLANAIPDVFGDSVQTYGTKPTKQKMRIPRVEF